MTKFEPGGWVNPNPVKETSGEYITSHSKSFSIGLSNYQARDYKTFRSWKEVIDQLRLTIDQVRRIRSGHMVYGWQLRHINGETFYGKNHRSSYIKKGTNKRKHPVSIKFPDGETIQFESMTEAILKTGLSYYIIRRMTWGYPFGKWEACDKNLI